MGSLTSTPSEADLERLTEFYEPDAVLYYFGMAAPPTTSYAEQQATVKGMMSYWALLERKVTTHVEDGNSIVNAMDNRLSVAGTVVESFPECEVVQFSDRGRIKRYELFCDPAPLMALLGAGNSLEKNE